MVNSSNGPKATKPKRLSSSQLTSRSYSTQKTTYSPTIYTSSNPKTSSQPNLNLVSPFLTQNSSKNSSSYGSSSNPIKSSQPNKSLVSPFLINNQNKNIQANQQQQSTKFNLIKQRNSPILLSQYPQGTISTGRTIAGRAIPLGAGTEKNVIDRIRLEQVNARLANEQQRNKVNQIRSMNFGQEALGMGRNPTPEQTAFGQQVQNQGVRGFITSEIGDVKNPSFTFGRTQFGSDFDNNIVERRSSRGQLDTPQGQKQIQARLDGAEQQTDLLGEISARQTVLGITPFQSPNQAKGFQPDRIIKPSQPSKVSIAKPSSLPAGSLEYLFGSSVQNPAPFGTLDSVFGSQTVQKSQQQAPRGLSVFGGQTGVDPLGLSVGGGKFGDVPFVTFPTSQKPFNIIGFGKGLVAGGQNLSSDLFDIGTLGGGVLAGPVGTVLSTVFPENPIPRVPTSVETMIDGITESALATEPAEQGAFKGLPAFGQSQKGGEIFNQSLVQAQIQREQDPSFELGATLFGIIETVAPLPTGAKLKSAKTAVKIGQGSGFFDNIGNTFSNAFSGLFKKTPVLKPKNEKIIQDANILKSTTQTVNEPTLLQVDQGSGFGVSSVADKSRSELQKIADVALANRKNELFDLGKGNIDNARRLDSSLDGKVSKFTEGDYRFLLKDNTIIVTNKKTGQSATLPRSDVEQPLGGIINTVESPKNQALNLALYQASGKKMGALDIGNAFANTRTTGNVSPFETGKVDFTNGGEVILNRGKAIGGNALEDTKFDNLVDDIGLFGKGQLDETGILGVPTNPRSPLIMPFDVSDTRKVGSSADKIFDDSVIRTVDKTTKKKGSNNFFNVENRDPIGGGSGQSKNVLVPRKQVPVNYVKPKPFNPLVPIAIGGGIGIAGGIGAGLLSTPDNIFDTIPDINSRFDDKLDRENRIPVIPIMDQPQDIIQIPKLDQPQIQSPSIDTPFPEGQRPTQDPAFDGDYIPQMPLLQYQDSPTPAFGKYRFPFNSGGSGAGSSSPDDGDFNFFRVFAIAKQPFGRTTVPLGGYVDSDRPIKEITDVLSVKEIFRENRIKQNPLRSPSNIVDEDSILGDMFGFGSGKKGKGKKGKKNSVFNNDLFKL